MRCAACGGSGVLHVFLTVNMATGEVSTAPRASWCHECETGAVWRELGLDE